MLQAIQTKFFGPTNVKGSRVKAKAAAGSLTIGWDHALNPERNHQAAAEAFKAKMGWTGELIGGCLHDGTYAFVFTSDRWPS